MPRTRHWHETWFLRIDVTVPRYYLGIDGGQSSTVALIADETGRVLGSGRSGPCNHVSAEEAAQKLKSVIGECVGQACAEAGLDFATLVFASACLGFSGGATDKEAHIRPVIRTGHCKVTSDAEIALLGATAGKPGVIVIAGTGSIAFGRNADGETARAGGWGYIFGDEGSAFDLTRQALRAILQFEEGWGPPTMLRHMFLDATQSLNALHLLHRFYTPEYPRARVASLARLVDRAAVTRDDVAVAILDEAASKLAWLVQAIWRNIFTFSTSVTVSYTGGVFQSEILRASFAARIRELLSSVISAPRFSPAGGAVLEALRMDGIDGGLKNLPEAEKSVPFTAFGNIR
jgi:N-acetylglucosamine kinase-like BadF-type ATPase